MSFTELSEFMSKDDKLKALLPKINEKLKNGILDGKSLYEYLVRNKTQNLLVRQILNDIFDVPMKDTKNVYAFNKHRNNTC